MKTEIVHIPGRGICILISDVDPKDFINGIKGIPTLDIDLGPFTNIYTIADQIRTGRKIAAIKEIRVQSGWGLKEAKEYLDKFFPMGAAYNMNPDDQRVFYNNCAEKFIKAHIPNDFLEKDEMEI